MVRVGYVNDDFRFGAFCPSVLGVPLLSVSLGRRASPSFWCSVDRFGCFVVVVGLIGSLTICLLDRLTGEAVSRSTEALLPRFVYRDCTHRHRQQRCAPLLVIKLQQPDPVRDVLACRLDAFAL
jgi:hypothetical protein